MQGSWNKASVQLEPKLLEQSQCQIPGKAPGANQVSNSRHGSWNKVCVQLTMVTGRIQKSMDHYQNTNVQNTNVHNTHTWVF